MIPVHLAVSPLTSLWRDNAPHSLTSHLRFTLFSPNTCGFTERICIMISSGDVREGNGTPLQYSCLENHMDGGAWWAAVHGVAESQTRLSDFALTFPFHALKREMATHSSVLAWRIPGMGEPGGLLFMGLQRVGRN